MQKHARQSTGPAGDAGYSASSSQSDACSLRIDVEQPVPQLAQPLRAPPQPIRSAGDVFGTPGVVTRIMVYCATLEDVSRLSRTCRGAARAPWPPVAPWVCVASMIAEPRHRRRDEPAFGRRVAHALGRSEAARTPRGRKGRARVTPDDPIAGRGAGGGAPAAVRHARLERGGADHVGVTDLDQAGAFRVLGHARFD